MSDEDFYLRVFRAFDGWDLTNGSLWWRVDEKYAPVTFLVNCNDLFFWGCSDCENLTPDNIHILEECKNDIMEADKKANPKKKWWTAGNADLLFCARVRGMRPQGAFYKHFKEHEKPLFDACGPERDIDIGNPQDKEGNYKYKREENV